MIRINIAWMLDVAKKLDELDTLQAGVRLDESVIFPVLEAQQQLEMVFNQSVYSQYLRASREKANELHVALTKVFDEDQLDKPVTAQDIAGIRALKDQFMLVFRSEAATLPIFLVSKKEPYDSISLVENGASLFPAALVAKAPETGRDCIEAGKALAFELGTACGFHAFCVTESVVKRYWDMVSSGKARPNLQTLGNYAAEMEKAKFGDEKIAESIKMMARLYRNPTIHPEVILTVEQAMGIVGMARSIVGAMLAVLPDVPLTTGSPGVSTPP
ncbi:MAG: hypothetical protein IT533_08015 [Hyphomicrobiales bacterium]|jgi:hypothetical protein|nr:hypothetical protein [Hyphomicrobiales bacterium]